ncbi:MAG TPA: hypothetical protein VJ656_00670, partial [Pyrinomonadaceae bacterium]|nr:hypothetical protein [Pyrinomonadaceae bacterium]
MKYVRSIQLAFSAFALLLFAIPVSAGDQVPLNGTFSGEVTLVTPLSAEVLLLQVSLSGISTHLGRFKGEAEIFQNIADGSYSGTFIW